MAERLLNPLDEPKVCTVSGRVALSPSPKSHDHEFIAELETDQEPSASRTHAHEPLPLKSTDAPGDTTEAFTERIA